MLRSLTDTALKLRGLAVDIRLGYLKAFQRCRYGGLHAPTHRVQAHINLLHGGVLLRGGQQQTFALTKQRVVLLDGCAQLLVLNTHIRRNHFVRVLRIVDIVPKELHYADLRLVLHTLLVVFRVLLKGYLRVAADIRQTGALLEGGKLVLRIAQFTVDDFQTLLYELGSLGRHFVLVVVRILVIAFNQGIDEIHRTVLIRIL